MKPFQIRAAVPLLDKHDTLCRAMKTAENYQTVSLTLYTSQTLSIPSHAAQAIIQSMIDAVEADLRALGVDLE